ncbi:MAG: hypothetical protein JRJ87_05660 [Deltaproteobacteria bacterium]|nr:hypothetical protein [Deltaproteobacteria bacterium]
MRPRAILAIAGILLIGTVVAAGPLDEISHRDKLFDITVRGNDVFIVGYPGLLLHSADKGQNFEQLDPGTKDVLYAIDMTPDGQGVIVGRAGLVLTSPDGGKSWVRQKTGIKQSLFDVAITAGGKIWAVGHFGTVIHSADGGKSWQAQEYDATPPVVEGDGHGGISSAEEENEGAAEEARLNSVAFADDQHGWIVGEFGLVLYTEDGGTSWKRQRSASGKLMFAVHAIDAQNVIASGCEGTYMTTSDGGLTWKAQKTNVPEHILGIWPQKDKTYLVGRDGLILVTSSTDSFKHLPAGLYTWLNAVEFVDSNLGFAVGGRGHLLKTVDAGKTWQRISGR